MFCSNFFQLKKIFCKFYFQLFKIFDEFFFIFILYKIFQKGNAKQFLRKISILKFQKSDIKIESFGKFDQQNLLKNKKMRRVAAVLAFFTIAYAKDSNNKEKQDKERFQKDIVIHGDGHITNTYHEIQEDQTESGEKPGFTPPGVEQRIVALSKGAKVHNPHLVPLEDESASNGKTQSPKKIPADSQHSHYVPIDQSDDSPSERDDRSPTELIQNLRRYYYSKNDEKDEIYPLPRDPTYNTAVSQPDQKLQVTYGTSDYRGEPAFGSRPAEPDRKTNDVDGWDNVVDGKANYVRGDQNLIYKGDQNTVRGDKNQIFFGNNNVLHGDGSLVIGSGNFVSTSNTPR